MSYSTYIIKSQKDLGYYYGHSQEPYKRLAMHNSRKVKSTKHRAPFTIHYLETFETRSKAYLLEMFFKSAEGKIYLK